MDCGTVNAHPQFSLFLVSLPFSLTPVGMSQRNLSPFTIFILVIKKILKSFAVTRRPCPKPYQLLHFYLPSDAGQWLGLTLAKL